MSIQEFFGWDGYSRTPEGAYSWQHLLYVSGLTIVMIVLGIVLGLWERNKDEKRKNLVLIITAALIDALYLLKILVFSFRGSNPLYFLYDLPLFLCSIMFLAIPLAAFSKGRLREAALDFILIFGILGGTMGNYGAAQNFNAYPVISFDNLINGLTHSISGFASIYIGVSGLASMKKKNIPITFAILLSFCLLAYIADILLPYNYMFLMNHDGTPYVIFYDLVQGNPVLYPIIVVVLFLLYIGVFYAVYLGILKAVQKAKKPQSV